MTNHQLVPATRADLPDMLTGLGLTGVGVEVGTYTGDFAVSILERWPGVLHCVDPYLHQPDWKDVINHDDAFFRHIQQEAERRLAPWITEGRCHLHVETSVEAATGDWARDLDFVYLDARHDYTHVMQDLEAWAPKIKPDGLLGGHDYLDAEIGPTTFEVRRAVQTWAQANGYATEEIAVTQEFYPSWFLRVRDHG